MNTVYARIENGVVAELFSPPLGLTLSDCMTSDVAKQFTQLDNALPFPQQGWTAAQSETGWSFAPPINIDLPTAQKQQIGGLSAECAAKITSGFTSSALGTSNVYASAQVDQRNLVQSAQSSKGGLLSSQNADGTWPRVMHSQAQAQQVLEDFVTARDTARLKLQVYETQVMAATTVEAVQAILWESTP